MYMSFSSCLQLLRFNINTTISSTSLLLASVNCVNVYSIRTIKVDSNLIANNFNKLHKLIFSILCRIPISFTRFSLIEYITQNQF